jgi:AcrR family transcriptional regulator
MVPTVVPRPSATAHLPADERRARIVAAFIQESLARGGLSVVGIRAVCAREGCTAPVLYRLFGDRAGLVQAALGSTRAPLLDGLEAAVATPGPVMDRLRSLVVAFFERPLGDEESFGALVTGECRRDPALSEVLRRSVARIESLLVALLERGRAAGEIRFDVDPHYVAWRLIDLGLFRNQVWLIGLEAPGRIDYSRRATRALFEEIAV